MAAVQDRTHAVNGLNDPQQGACSCPRPSAPGGAASAIEAVADGGRLVTITSDPPRGQRGITVSSIYIRPNGNQLRELLTRFADGQLEIPVAASYCLADAAPRTAPKQEGYLADPCWRGYPARSSW
jgi:hypothetical protein